MRLSTDDDIYRARLLYLGAPGYTMPVQLPYAEWGLFVLLGGSFCVIALLATGNPMSLGAAIAAAMFATSWIWGQLDPDLPARKFLKVRLTDWRTTRPPAGDARLPSMTARRIRIGERP